MIQELDVFFAVGNDGQIHSVDALNAYLGFMAMDDGENFHITPRMVSPRLFEQALAFGEFGPNDILVADVNASHKTFRALGVDIPAPIDYPECLTDYLPRPLFATTLGEAMARARRKSELPFFVKPRSRAKAFNGMVLRTHDDVLALLHLDEEMTVWTMDAVDYRSEWRVFVKHGEFAGMKPYKGDAFIAPDHRVVFQAIDDLRREWVNRPAFFSLDFGLTAARGQKVLQTRLVEANDGYALGSYDLDSRVYAEGLLARWQQIVAPVLASGVPARQWRCLRCRDRMPADFPANCGEPDSRGTLTHPSGAFLTSGGGSYCGDCAPDVRQCRECGCTQEAGCPCGCSWVARDLCSAHGVQRLVAGA